MSRIKTNKNFKGLLPFSGDVLPTVMFTDGGLWHHLSIVFPSGGRAILSVPEDVVNKYPEYFEYKN